MPIQVTCACGKSIQVPVELAGKKVRCPACAGVLAVPAPTAGDEPGEAALNVVEPEPGAEESTRPRKCKKSDLPRRLGGATLTSGRSETSVGKRVAGAVLFLAAAGLGVWFLRNMGPRQTGAWSIELFALAARLGTAAVKLAVVAVPAYVGLKWLLGR